MTGEKKHWRLSTPFRRSSPKQDPQHKIDDGRTRSRISSVYLSDNSCASGFVIVPEFDYPVEQPTHGSDLSFGPSSPISLDGGSTNFESTGSQPSYSSKDFFDGQGDDLAQRLGVAYEHIRSMPSAASHKASLSSDPQILRKQLGVPQHSVFNYPIHSSPDLPNPHPPDSTYLGLPAATPLDLSHTTSNKLGLRINTDTDIYSPSPSNHSQKSTQFTKIRSVATTPAATENSPSHCSTLGTPWSTRVVCTAKSQDSITKLSKRVKRRLEKPPSSAPSSGRRALRGVLCKPNTPSSTNMHRRQISLPQIRSPSPLMVNIPLHHAWHDRQTDFNSSTKYHPNASQRHEKSSRRASGSTEILASLAWIGTPHTANWRHDSESPDSFSDHFSMGIAVEDDSLSDDDLVDQLEKVRRINGGSEQSRNASPLGFSGSAQFSGSGGSDAFSPKPCPPSSPSTPDQLSQPCHVQLPSSMSKDTVSDSEDAAVWQAARKALLCIREIVRTEKKYQEALKMLLNAQTTTPPPPSMSPYVSALVRVSEMLLRRFLEDPSAWGVSTAFVTSEDELEASMVSWCAVAGAFFTDGNDSQSSGSIGRWRLRKSGVIPISSPSTVTKQTSAPHSPQLPPMFSMMSSANRIKERAVDEYCIGQRPPTRTEKQTSTPVLQSTSKPAVTGQLPCRKLSVRDLAIQPIQRVMRYVLLYKDLLNCIPVMSPPRLLAERALEAAMRIANHCDKAQRNPAFYHAP